jgi:hypothetical protein
MGMTDEEFRIIAEQRAAKLAAEVVVTVEVPVETPADVLVQTQDDSVAE